MSTWQNDAAANFSDALYGDDEDNDFDDNKDSMDESFSEDLPQIGVEVQLEEDNENEVFLSFPQAATKTYSPNHRSRSPLQRYPHRGGEEEQNESSEYEVQDSCVYGGINDDDDSANESDCSKDDGDGERLGVRVGSRQRGRSGMRGRGSRRRGGKRGGIRASRVKVKTPGHWSLGDPLQIIWTDDDDVPVALREMVTEVARKRKERVREYMVGRNARGRPGREDIESDDEFYDAEGDSLLDGDNRIFEWSSDMKTFRKDEVPFKPKRTGSVGNFSTAYDAFRSYWDDEILNTLVEQTNMYATTINTVAFHQSWVPTNAHEIMCLFAFWMMLGIIRMPTIKSCFSDEALLRVDIFKKIFSISRYTHLVRALHFLESDASTHPVASTSMSGARAADRMHSLRPILDHLNAKFQANYIPSKDISISESFALGKGWATIKQYLRTKVSGFGFRTYELCEAATGYLWSFLVYTGAHANPNLPYDPSPMKTTAVVRMLMKPLLNKGYRLFMDNCYNSPLLARWLKINGTDCVGSLRSNRSDVPPIIHLAELKHGQLLARHSGDVCVAAWQDKKKFVTISTCHGVETGLPKVLSRPLTRPLPFKPQVVLDYNRFMCGVDLKDQMLEPYMLEEKRCRKWYMKLFKRLLNCSILNARILLESSMRTPQNQMVFTLSLVNSILVNHLPLCPTPRRLTNRLITDPTRMTTNTHWPVHIPQTSADAARNRQSRQRCCVCRKTGNKLQRTPYQCERCNVPLCIDKCFKLYHTTPNM